MKIAVIIPIPYEGGTLRVGKSISKMLKQHLNDIGGGQVVFANPEGKYCLKNDLYDLIDAGIEVRNFSLKSISQADAQVILNKMGRSAALTASNYVIPHDGIYDFTDVDYWLFISDRIFGNLIPIQRTGIIATDYIQRYVPETFDQHMYENQKSFCYELIRNIRNADDAYAMTPGTLSDLKHYAGRRTCDLLPLVLDDSFADSAQEQAEAIEKQEAFIWVTNGSYHKNHINTLNGLIEYYKKGGRLKCIITGVNTHFFNPEFEKDPHAVHHHPYHKKVRKMIASNLSLKENLTIMGNVPDHHYVKLLKSSQFLLHSVIADNGTFSVIEAALLGIDSVSSRYPQQEFINETFGLDMTFFDPFNPKELSDALLKKSELNSSKSKINKSKIEQMIWRNQCKNFSEVVVKNMNQARTNGAFYA